MRNVIVGNLRCGGGSLPDYQDVRCDRQSILGNPFPMGRGGRDESMRDVCVEAHSEYLEAVLAVDQSKCARWTNFVRNKGRKISRILDTDNPLKI